jgi:hypothetical protein
VLTVKPVGVVDGRDRIVDTTLEQSGSVGPGPAITPVNAVGTRSAPMWYRCLSAATDRKVDRMAKQAAEADYDFSSLDEIGSDLKPSWLNVDHDLILNAINCAGLAGARLQFGTGDAGDYSINTYYKGKGKTWYPGTAEAAGVLLQQISGFFAKEANGKR